MFYFGAKDQSRVISKGGTKLKIKNKQKAR